MRTIEVAFGETLSPELRTQIEKVTTNYLQQAQAENTGLMKDAIQRVKRMRKSAQSLLASIEDRSGGTRAYVDDEVEMSYERLVQDKLRELLGIRVLPPAAQNHVIEASGVDLAGVFRGPRLARFVGACDLTLKSLEWYSQCNYWPEGGAWEHWIRQLSDILEAHHLPIGARKDAAGYGVEKASPFVKFVSSLHAFLPKEHVPGDTKSKSSLAERIYKARVTPKPAVAPRTTGSRQSGRDTERRLPLKTPRAGRPRSPKRSSHEL